MNTDLNDTFAESRLDSAEFLNCGEYNTFFDCEFLNLKHETYISNDLYQAVLALQNSINSVKLGFNKLNRNNLI